MKKMIVLSLAICFLALGSNRAAFAEWDPAQVELERVIAEDTMAQFKERAPRTARFFDNAYGYAVFPTIGKGAFIIGAAKGSGLVYEKGEIVGRVTLAQGTVGLQAGGQTYSQIIFFADRVALDSLTDNQLRFSGTASAVAANKGASAAVDYQGGVSVFTMGETGLMLEASMGGQKFIFEPNSQ